MIKDLDNHNIEFRFQNHSTGYRQILWRIVPSELGIWDRLFHNPWRVLYRACYRELTSFFKAKHWKDARELTTYRAIMEYQAQEEEKARKALQRDVELGVAWGDEEIYVNE